MQDVHLIGDGRVFTGTDRRLRQTHLQNQALKCPRCDSLNTKFCYYNNYNLSQPRHFCKSCRRYWTKGGVLRNVPVGGGCRKSSKRSSSSAKLSKAGDGCGKPKLNNSNSSSESSNVTNAAVAVDAVDITAAPSTSVATPPSAEGVSCTFETVFGFGDGKYIFPQIKNPNFTSDLVNIADGNGSDEGGCFNFATMMTPSSNTTSLNNQTAPYDVVVTSYGMNQSQYDQRQFEQWQLGSEEANMGGVDGDGRGYINPTVHINHSSNLGSQPLSWQDHEEQQHMFGLTSAVDQVYWNQQQWSNDDNPNPHLYLP